MPFRIIFLASICLLFAIGFQVQLLAEEEVPKIFLEEVLSIGSLEDDVLFQWVGVTSDSEDHIYVTDAMDYSLKKFNSQGLMLKKAGRKGQGPGEFMAPRLLDSLEKCLYVTDQSIPGIQVFNKDLKFLYRIPLKMPVVDFKVLSDVRVAVSTLASNQSGRIFIFDQNGKVIREFLYADKKSPLMMDIVTFDIDSLGNFYLVYTYQDKIEKFNANGKKLWSKKLLKVKKVKRKKISVFVVPTEIVYKDVALDRSEKLYVLGGSFSKNPSRDVYVLSPEGEFLAYFTLPEASHCIYIDSQNFLYSRANSGVTLKKYKLVSRK